MSHHFDVKLPAGGMVAWTDWHDHLDSRLYHAEVVHIRMRLTVSLAEDSCSLVVCGFTASEFMHGLLR